MPSTQLSLHSYYSTTLLRCLNLFFSALYNRLLSAVQYTDRCSCFYTEQRAVNDYSSLLPGL